MKNRAWGLRRLTAVAALAAAWGSPALAADDGTTTGILAGVGLSAAKGTTTISGGAGGIEAGLLNSDAFQKAGTIVASLVNHVAPGRKVLVVAHDEPVSLIMPMIVRERIAAVDRLLVAASHRCGEKAPQARPSIESLPYLDLKGFLGGGTLQGSDIVGAIATDTTIAGISLTADDRLLIDSLLLNARARSFDTDAGSTSWRVAYTTRPDTTKGDDQAAAAHTPVKGGVADYVVPGELTNPGSGETSRAYLAMLSAADALRGRENCTSAPAKAALSAADALATSLNAGDKAGQTPLAIAIQLDALAGTKPPPLVLRLAIEQVGGTSIARSGVLYTLGFPGAATVSAGLVVGFRLVDPQDGAVAAIGIVRCAVAPQNIKHVRRVIEINEQIASCSYRAS